MNSLDPVYQKDDEPTIISDSCNADVYLENENMTPVKVEFCYIIMPDGFINVTVKKIEKEFFGVPSDLRYDVTVAIGQHVNRKINEISWT